MNKKSLIMAILIASFILMAYPIDAKYSFSVPFKIDRGGQSVGLTTVHINISESANCRTPFYFNKTTTAYGTGQFNITSSSFEESRTYYYCWNATAGANKIFGGPIPFQVGVGRGQIANNTAQGKIYLNASKGIWLPWKTTIGNGTLGYLNVTPTIIKLAQNTQLWVTSNLLIRNGLGVDGTGSLTVRTITGNNDLDLKSNPGTFANIQLNAFNGKILFNSSNAIIANETITIRSNDDNTLGQLTLESTGVDSRLELYNSHGNNATGRASLLMSRTGGFQGLRFMIANTDYMILNWQGRLGLGTTAPKHLADIRGDINSTGTLNISKIKAGNIKINNNNVLVNNTAQGKVYLNSTLMLPRRINITSGSPVIAYISSDNRLNQTTSCDAGAFCNFTWLKRNTPADFWIALGSTNTIMGTIFKSMRFANNLVPNADNTYDLGSVISGTSLYWRNISSYKFQLKNGSNFDSIYGVRAAGLTNNTNDLFQFGRSNFTKYSNFLFGKARLNFTIGDSSTYSLNITGRYMNISNGFRISFKQSALNITNSTHSIFTIKNKGNISFKNNNTGYSNCQIRIKNNGSWGMLCDGRGQWSGWKNK